MKIIQTTTGKILAKHIQTNDIKEGLSFFSDDADFLQVGAWKYSSGKELLAHQHNWVERKVERTQEVLIIQHGSVRAHVFDEEKNLIEELVVRQGEILILLNGAHGYKILEEGTQVIEIKNGPYLGAEIDRVRI